MKNNYTICYSRIDSNETKMTFFMSVGGNDNYTLVMLYRNALNRHFESVMYFLPARCLKYNVLNFLLL